ncbi:MAG: B12-binding domain-containing protein [Planctomycetes bacterium]|nr:B12-binding domain-containing protein [Planctomycetota bacterium]
MPEPLLTRYLQPLLAGRRAECFALMQDAIAAGRPAADLLHNVVLPSIAQVERLFRDDRINIAHESMTTRINRTVADQLQAHLSKAQPRGKRVLVYCADEPREEVGAQAMADLLQAEGWEVFLVGGDVPYDEMVTLTGQLRPAVLLIFGTQPGGVPMTRNMVLNIREIGLCPDMNIVVSGGVFNRADGLWREVGADVFADNARDVVEILGELRPRVPGVRPTGLVKQRRRKRKAS